MRSGGAPASAAGYGKSWLRALADGSARRITQRAASTRRQVNRWSCRARRMRQLLSRVGHDRDVAGTTTAVRTILRQRSQSAFITSTYALGEGTSTRRGSVGGPGAGRAHTETVRPGVTFRRPTWHGDPQTGSRCRRRVNLQEAADCFHSLSHAHQAESAIRYAVDVKSLPIVGDHERQARGRPGQLDPDVACVAMLDGVPQRFLRDSEQAQGDVLIDDGRYIVMGEGHG